MPNPNCPKCHGTGWDGDGYTLSCAGCSPSLGDLHVDKTCERERDESGMLVSLTREAKIEKVKQLLQEVKDILKEISSAC